MKKLMKMILMIVMVLGVAGCSQNETEENTSSRQSNSTPQENLSDTNKLIVYFSWSGNTRRVAEEIQRQTDAQLVELEPQQPYTSDYNELLDVAREQQRQQARPAIANIIANIDSYDVIFVGYPNWWGDMPMILYTFFDQYDLSGKTIVPFVTSGGSGFSDTLATIEELESDATLLEGLSLSDDEADHCSSEVQEWLQQNNIK